MDKAKASALINDLKSKSALDPAATFRLVCDRLRDFHNYDWVGIYVLRKDKLVLDAYNGEETEHGIITLGDGLCSMAIVQDAIINEKDVKSNGKYLACFPTTNSELVVPIRHDGKPVGEIDIDSDKPGAFSKEDEEFVMQIGELIGEKVYSVYEP